MLSKKKFSTPSDRDGVIRVIIVEDSHAMQLLLERIINQQPDMSVVAVASNVDDARVKIRELAPDVVTLDNELPGMSGLEFLRRIMRLNPMPVIMISGGGAENSDLALEALSIGAVDFVSKLQLRQGGLQTMAEELLAKIRAAAQSKVRARVAQPSSLVGKVDDSLRFRVGRYICVGASTGGTEALRDFLMVLPKNIPPVVIVQHMPAGFTARFAQRLDRECSVRVKEAEQGDKLQAGWAYIAPGHAHIVLTRRGSDGIYIDLSEGPEVHHHRPAVDVMFHSAAKVMGSQATAVLLTGMGKDGALGMKAMRDQGAYTYGQDEASCVVYGMPKAAFDIGAVCEQGDPAKIAAAVIKRLAIGSGQE